MPKLPRLNPYVAIIFTIFLFSTIEVAIKLIGTGIDPFLLAAIRFIGAGVAMIPFSPISPLRVLSSNFREICIIALVGIVGTFAPYHWGVPRMNASTAALIFSLNPLFATVSARYILHEPLSSRIIIALILGFLGVYISVAGYALPQFNALVPPLLLLISAIAFGVYTVISKQLLMKYGAIALTSTVFILGGMCMLPLVKSWKIPTDIYTLTGIVYLTLVVTFIGYLSYFYGLKRVSIARGSFFFFFKPIIAMALSIVLLKESLTTSYFVGVFVILCALIVTLIPEKKK